MASSCAMRSLGRHLAYLEVLGAAGTHGRTWRGGRWPHPPHNDQRSWYLYVEEQARTEGFHEVGGNSGTCKCISDHAACASRVYKQQEWCNAVSKLWFSQLPASRGHSR